MRIATRLDREKPERSLRQLLPRRRRLATAVLLLRVAATVAERAAAAAVVVIVVLVAASLARAAVGAAPRPPQRARREREGLVALDDAHGRSAHADGARGVRAFGGSRRRWLL